MGTTTGDSSAPLRRTLVWSHNTSYPGAAGVHSETGKKADVIQLGSQRELGTSLSNLRAIHQKELRNLHQHRKSLETSMLAYTEKMRKISSERFQLAHLPRERNLEGSIADRLTAPTDSVSTMSDSRGRVSVDSGVDVTMNDVTKKTSSNRDSVVMAASSSPKVTSKARPTSFRSVDETHSAKQAAVRPRNADQASPSVVHRRRRAGTMEQPDIFSLKLSMQRKERRDQQPSVKDQQSSPSSQEGSVSPLEIMPFPEFKTSARSGGAESDMLLKLHDDFDRTSGTSSRTSQSSTKKLMKPKENYWSYRKSPTHRLSLPLPQSQAARKKSSASEPPQPIIPRPRPLDKKKVTPRRSNKTYHKSFRYSIAVDDVLHSLDEGVSRPVTKKTIRRVSESLPVLDLQELKVEKEKQRTRQDTHRSSGTLDTRTSSFFLSASQDTDANVYDTDNRSQHSAENDSQGDRHDVQDEGLDNKDYDDGAREGGHGDDLGEESAEGSWKEHEDGVHELSVHRDRSLSVPDRLLHQEADGKMTEESSVQYILEDDKVQQRV